MMKRFRLQEIAIVLSLLFVATGQSDCETDEDGDGWSPSQGDCDDTNADVYPGAEELSDGLDNDCDGMVDEVAYSIHFYEIRSWRPVPEVNVWLGTEGEGPVWISDEAGEVTFETEISTQDLSFAYYQRNRDAGFTSDSLWIYTFLEYALSPEIDHYIPSDIYVGDPIGVIEGVVTGADESLTASVLTVQTEDVGTWVDGLGPERPYSLNEYREGTPHVLAEQWEDEETVGYNFPALIGYQEILDGRADVALDTPFSGTFTFDVSEIDPDMLSWYPDLNIAAPDGTQDFFYTDYEYSLSEIATYALTTPYFSGGSLAGAQLDVRALFMDASRGQATTVYDVGPNDAYPITMPAIHGIPEHVPVGLSSWEGRKVDLLEAVAVSPEVEGVGYVNYRRNLDVDSPDYGVVLYDSWVVRRYSGSRTALTVPTLPLGATVNWGEQGANPAYETVVDYAFTWMSWSDPVFGYLYKTSYDLDLASEVEEPARAEGATIPVRSLKMKMWEHGELGTQ